MANDPQRNLRLLSARENMWGAFEERFDSESFARLRARFDERIGDPEEGIEGAYQGILEILIPLMDGLNHQTISLLTALCGHSPQCDGNCNEEGGH